MTEDEAFVRAVVDAPGDDTPRLVYADWLDDRDDPRGPYLRAEREAVVTRDTARLRELAAGLDPVWVARVSRPPLGVCCRHIKLSEGGPRVTDADLEEAERTLGVPLPAAYRAFLLNYNGGRPTPAPGSPGLPGGEVGEPVEYFDPLADVAAHDGHPGRRRLGELPEHPRLRDCIPIGAAAADEDAIYLDCTAGHGGRVYVWHEHKTGDPDPDLVELLAKTFGALLHRTRVRPLR